MPTLLTDPERERRLRAEWLDNSDGDKWSEVWEGLRVMPTLPNDEHQDIQNNLQFVLTENYGRTGLGKVRGGVNVTDRHPNWTFNFRGPDVVLYLPENPAINYGTHWLGGPDFLVEIISPKDYALDKFDFYAKVNTREVLIVDRDPWTLELYQLLAGKLELPGRSDLANPAVLASSVLPLTFQLLNASPRPIIHMAHTSNGQTWIA